MWHSRGLTGLSAAAAAGGCADGAGHRDTIEGRPSRARGHW